MPIFPSIFSVIDKRSYYIALFKWNDDVTPAHIAATATALSGLPEVIDTILDYRHAADIGINQGNFDYGVTADFADEAGYLTYRDHPAHQAVLSGFIVGHVAQRVAVQLRLEA